MSARVAWPGLADRMRLTTNIWKNYMKTMYGVNKDLIFKLTSMLGQF